MGNSAISSAPMKNKTLLLREKVFSRLVPNFGPNCDLPRHRWFKFKEAFSASLVSSLLLNYVRETPGIVIDPFLGSGTTALEAGIWGWETFGSEVNPFMQFVAKIKTESSYDSKLVFKYSEVVLNYKGKAHWKIPRDTTLVETPSLGKWFFNKSVARRFETLRMAITTIKDIKHAQLLLLALISAMEDVSNARRDGKCWKYKKDWKRSKYTGKELDAVFRQKVTDFCEDIKYLGQISGKTRIKHGDARTINWEKILPKDKYADAILTSPPYLNSFDYTDIYRPNMYLLGAARSSEDLIPYRINSIRSHVQASWPVPAELKLGSLQTVIQKLLQVKLWDSRIPLMVNAYFHDLETVLKKSIVKLKPGGKVFFVVARSAYSGIVVPVDSILVDIFSRNGVKVIDTIILREGLGNGQHQKCSTSRLPEVLIIGQKK